MQAGWKNERTIALCTNWRRSSSANQNSVLRKEYRREDQYLSIEMQPEINESLVKAKQSDTFDYSLTPYAPN